MTKQTSHSFFLQDTSSVGVDPAVWRCESRRLSLSISVFYSFIRTTTSVTLTWTPECNMRTPLRWDSVKMCVIIQIYAIYYISPPSQCQVSLLRTGVNTFRLVCTSEFISGRRGCRAQTPSSSELVQVSGLPPSLWRHSRHIRLGRIRPRTLWRVSCLVWKCLQIPEEEQEDAAEWTAPGLLYSTQPLQCTSGAHCDVQLLKSPGWGCHWVYMNTAFICRSQETKWE